MRKLYAGLAGVVLGLAFHISAQTAMLGSFSNAAPPDSIVQVAADSQGLQQVALADLPRGGTFWYVTPGGIAAPFPCPPQDANAIIYQITDTAFLVDQTGGQVTVNTHRLGMQTTTTSSISAALSSQADAVVNLITQIQTQDDNRQMRTMLRSFGMDDGAPSPGDGGSYGGTNYTDGGYFNYTFDTNQLWLEITNVVNGWSGLNLHNATNQVYAIWGTTNLLGSWNVETELWPTPDQTNVLPFAIQNFDRQNLFLRAEDWTGVDSNGDGIPDWWIFKYFGDLSETSTNLDSQGNTLGYDYANRIDPNVISFTVEAANDYVNTTTANAQINITTGNPSYYAVLVNGQTTTNWLPFVSTNLAVYLGSTDGVYNVNIGLRGLPADASQTWRDYSFTLDRVAPVLTIINPVGSTVMKPYLQLQGFASEPLVSLSYDISNADGYVTNLDAFVTDQSFDTNKFDFTTNYFQAYDVPLATNANYITLRVTDRAGNTTTTNFNAVLDYTTATNPPVVQLIWPMNGMAVSGSNCTIRGTMSDETGSIVAQIVNGEGTTNTINGIVERNNMFWIENVPLNGTNQISIQATDAAGNVTTTNFTVIPSEIILTIDNTPTGDDLYQPYGSVSGTVDAGCTVIVNGIEATNYWPNTDGTYVWSADNVPVYGLGTATFDVKAQCSASLDANAAKVLEMPAKAVMVNHSFNLSENCVWPWGWERDSYVKNYSEQIAANNSGQWTRTYQGTLNDGSDGSGSGDIWYEHYQWSDSNPGTVQADDNAYGSYSGPIPGEDIDESLPQTIYSYYSGIIGNYYAKNVVYQWTITNETYKGTITAKTEVKLHTGGKALIMRQSLFCIQCGATGFTEPTDAFAAAGGMPPWWWITSATIDPTSLTVAGKHPGSDGKVWVVFQDNTVQDITVHAPGKNHFNATATPTKYKLQIVVNGSNPLWPDLVPDYNKYCVGQYLGFDQQFIPALPETPRYNPIQWVLDGVYVNTNLPLQYSDGSSNYSNNPAFLKSQSTHAWWIDGAYDPPPSKASIGEGLTFANGQYVAIATHGIFTIHRPRLVNYIADTDSIGEAVLHAHATGDPASGDKLACAPGANYDLQVESRFSGGAFVTQTLNGQRTNHVYCFSYTNGDYLDKTEVYGVPFDETNRLISVIPNVVSTPLHFEDQPSIICIGNTSDHIHFTDYIRFQPDGGIPVTLGIVTWHNAGDTSLSTISGTTNQDYIPFPSSTDPQSESTGAYLSPTGSAAFDNFTTDSTLARWIHNATNSVTVSY